MLRLRVPPRRGVATHRRLRRPAGAQVELVGLQPAELVGLEQAELAAPQPAGQVLADLRLLGQQASE